APGSDKRASAPRAHEGLWAEGARNGGAAARPALALPADAPVVVGLELDGRVASRALGFVEGNHGAGAEAAEALLRARDGLAQLSRDVLGQPLASEQRLGGAVAGRNSRREHEQAHGARPSSVAAAAVSAGAGWSALRCPGARRA